MSTTTTDTIAERRPAPETIHVMIEAAVGKSLAKAEPSRMSAPHPFLKWAGGKTWLLPTLRCLRPKQFNRYHEPFIGGGAHFFDLVSSGFTGEAYLYDFNSELIRTYLAVRDNPSLVLEKLAKHITCHSQAYFHELRAFSLDDIRRLGDDEVAARMIYLNRAGFNGLYKVNKLGNFNVAWGKRERITFDEGNLFRASSALRSAVICQGDFGNILTNVRAGDFVFADPPYFTNGFKQYTAVGFDESDQYRLHQVCVELDTRNVSFIETNADCLFIRNLYRNFHIIPVQAKRNINCRGSGRGCVGEVLIMNY